MRYVLVPVPSEYVLDVMRWVLFRAPDEEGESTGRDAARVEDLLTKLDDFERSLLILIAKSVGGEDALGVSDAAAELEKAPRAVGEAVLAINRKAMWGRDVISLRPETAVGVRGRQGKLPVLTMWPEIAQSVRVAARSQRAPEG